MLKVVLMEGMLAYIIRINGSFYSPCLVEVTVIEDKKELIVLVKSMHSMCDSLGKVPDITQTQLDVLIDAVLINSIYQNAASVDEAPFSLGRGISTLLACD
jgi:hypothetical protein